MASHELKYTAEEIDGILESVDEKTIYDDATQSTHGLMSATDKSKLDALPSGTQIEESLQSKVDKVDGKGLSENDYTDEDKASVASAYHKPSSGIPKNDLDQGVQTSLGKADTALQSFTETDPTVPSWAKQQNKPSYNYSEIGNTPDLSGFITKSVNDLTNYYLKSETYTKTEVAALIEAIQQFHYEIYHTLPASGKNNVLYLIGPTGSGSDRYEEYVYANNAWSKIGDTSIDLSGYVTISALNTALAGYVSSSDLTTTLAAYATEEYVDDELADALASYTLTSQLATVATSGDYEDLTNKPSIPTVPTNVSSFTNDAGYLTQHQSLSGYATEAWVGQQGYLTQHQDISGKADKTLVASTMPSGGFLPNVVYNLGTLSGNTTFSMAAATDNTIANIWCWTFTTPSTAPTITWPAGITWSGGSQPTINASKSYEITVMNGLATIIES